MDMEKKHSAFARAANGIVVATTESTRSVSTSIYRCNNCSTVVTANEGIDCCCPACGAGDLTTVARNPEFATEDAKKMYAIGACPDHDCGCNLYINEVLAKSLDKSKVDSIHCVVCGTEVPLDEATETDILMEDESDDSEGDDDSFIPDENDDSDFFEEEDDSGFSDSDNIQNEEDLDGVDFNDQQEDEYEPESDDTSDTEVEEFTTDESEDEEMARVTARVKAVYPNAVKQNGNVVTIEAVNYSTNVPKLYVSPKAMENASVSTFVAHLLKNRLFVLSSDDSSSSDSSSGTVDTVSIDTVNIDPSGEIDDTNMSSEEDIEPENVENIDGGSGTSAITVVKKKEEEVLPGNNDEETIDLLDETQEDLESDGTSLDEAVPEESDETAKVKYTIVKASEEHNSPYVFFVNNKPVAKSSIANVAGANLISIYNDAPTFKKAFHIAFASKGREVLSSFGFKPITLKLKKKNVIANSLKKDRETAAIAYAGKLNDLENHFNQALEVTCAGMSKGMIPCSFYKSVADQLELAGIRDSETVVTPLLNTGLNTLFKEVLAHTKAYMNKTAEELNAVAEMVQTAPSTLKSGSVLQSSFTPPTPVTKESKESKETASFGSVSTKKPSVSNIVGFLLNAKRN